LLEYFNHIRTCDFCNTQRNEPEKLINGVDWCGCEMIRLTARTEKNRLAEMLQPSKTGKYEPSSVIDRRSLREIASSGRTVLNAWCAMPNTMSTEVLALQDWDTMTVDLQHGIVDYQMAVEMIRVIEGRGKTVMARVPWLDPAATMKLLDAGVMGLICPMVSTPELAAQFVSYCRYPPQGIRSFGPTRAALADPNYASTANDRIICAVQIEEAAAVDALDEIASVPGLDMLYVGPADLGLTLGFKPQFDPDVQELLAVFEKVIAACERHNLVPAIHCLTPAYAARMHALGFRFITLASDLRILARAVKETIDEARSRMDAAFKAGAQNAALTGC
jgi:4-hydroxy-2-oxoheptanedioate aldolase